jgi:hypothetical protein
MNNRNLLTMICALMLVHVDLFTFHTILNIYYHGNKIPKCKMFILWMYDKATSCLYGSMHLTHGDLLHGKAST